jgi:hypothetical protein
MRKSRSIGYYERKRDACGRFVARAGLNGNINSPRTHNQTDKEGGSGVVGSQETQEEVDATQQGTQPLAVKESYQILFSEEDTEQWEDVKYDETSEKLAWDFLDFRRRSSALSNLVSPNATNGSVEPDICR